MSSRIVVLVLAALFLAAVSLAHGQQPERVRKIGYLTDGGPAPTPNQEAFRQGLRDLGYIEGKTILIEYRYADGKVSRLPELAAELVRLKVDIIVVTNSAVARGAKKATSTIPIVMANGSDPTQRELVASLARPGGNVTD